ncbi:MAG: FAD/NAD(P)-binding protein [Variovorax sp.]
MPANPIETDYLIVGTGAVAMAFADTLVDHTDAQVVMVDRHHRPGGHWNDAYPFVRLHQPSAYYGVNSRELGSGGKDLVGLNQGLHELASGTEVLEYFEQVMNQRLLPSGRVRYFPMCDYAEGADGTHGWTSKMNGRHQPVVVRRKVVDGTLTRTRVPSTHAPSYRVAAGVRCMPPNALPALRETPARYTVVGGGKTAIDTCLWLLHAGAEPHVIRWIRPREAWLLDRANVQPSLPFFERSIGSLVAQVEAIASAGSVAELFARLEEQGQLLRIDPAVTPTMYRCATISQPELAALRRIEDVVRMGHVTAIEPGHIVLEHGSIPTVAGEVVIDCCADGIPSPPAQPVFERDRIRLMMVRTCQPALSGALIAFVETHIDEPAEKNAMCAVVPTPAHPMDWLRMWAVSLANAQQWRKHPEVGQWLSQSRLNSLTTMMRGMPADDVDRHALLKRYGAGAAQAMAKLPQLLAEAA